MTTASNTPEVRTVRIRVRDHTGWHMSTRAVTVPWTCTLCGGPRREPVWVGHEFKPSAHQWGPCPTCGGWERYEQVEEQAAASGLPQPPIVRRGEYDPDEAF